MPDHTKEANRRKVAKWQAGTKYGITVERRAEMLAEQGGCCAICGTDKPGANRKMWSLDHDHRFPRNDPKGHRGLLCNGCNRALGYFSDSLEKLRSAVRYLERYEDGGTYR